MLSVQNCMTTDFFPYKKVREEQKEMLEKVADSVQEGTHLIVHAPTGLGKTAATLAPALSSAKKDGKIVFFLTFHIIFAFPSNLSCLNLFLRRAPA